MNVSSAESRQKTTSEDMRERRCVATTNSRQINKNEINKFDIMAIMLLILVAIVRLEWKCMRSTRVIIIRIEF